MEKGKFQVLYNVNGKQVVNDMHDTTLAKIKRKFYKMGIATTVTIWSYEEDKAYYYKPKTHQRVLPLNPSI